MKILFLLLLVSQIQCWPGRQYLFILNKCSTAEDVYVGVPRGEQRYWKTLDPGMSLFINLLDSVAVITIKAKNSTKATVWGHQWSTDSMTLDVQDGFDMAMQISSTESSEMTTCTNLNCFGFDEHGERITSQKIWENTDGNFTLTYCP